MTTTSRSKLALESPARLRNAYDQGRPIVITWIGANAGSTEAEITAGVGQPAQAVRNVLKHLVGSGELIMRQDDTNTGEAGLRYYRAIDYLTWFGDYHDNILAWWDAQSQQITARDMAVKLLEYLPGDYPDAGWDAAQPERAEPLAIAFATLIRELASPSIRLI